MQKYQYLLFDNDGTLMDFDKAEAVAFEQTYNSYNFEKPYSVDLLNSYSACNLRWWKKHELQQCTKDQLAVGRFSEFLSENNLTQNAEKMNETYKKYLSMNNQLIDGALEMLENLSKDYTIYIITNGIATTQHGRIDTSPISKYIDRLFISEEAGYSKPSGKFFDYIFKEGKIEDKSKCLVIGDSLTSDIKGANNYGLDCIWYNPQNDKNTDYIITYEAKNIKDVEDFIQNQGDV